jgi:hypothetical protein
VFDATPVFFDGAHLASVITVSIIEKASALSFENKLGASNNTKSMW